MHQRIPSLKMVTVVVSASIGNYWIPFWLFLVKQYSQHTLCKKILLKQHSFQRTCKFACLVQLYFLFHSSGFHPCSFHDPFRPIVQNILVSKKLIFFKLCFSSLYSCQYLETHNTCFVKL